MERLGLGDGLGQLTARPVIIALLMLGENLGWAFGSNLAVLPPAALGLVNPMLASAAMACSSVSVVGNSLRLRRFARGRPRTRHRRSKPGTTSAPSDQRDGQ